MGQNSLQNWRFLGIWIQRIHLRSLADASSAACCHPIAWRDTLGDSSWSLVAEGGGHLQVVSWKFHGKLIPTKVPNKSQRSEVSSILFQHLGREVGNDNSNTMLWLVRWLIYLSTIVIFDYVLHNFVRNYQKTTGNTTMVTTSRSISRIFQASMRTSLQLPQWHGSCALAVAVISCAIHIPTYPSVVKGGNLEIPHKRLVYLCLCNWQIKYNHRFSTQGTGLTKRQQFTNVTGNSGKHWAPYFHGFFKRFSRPFHIFRITCNFIKVDQLHKGSVKNSSLWLGELSVSAVKFWV